MSSSVISEALPSLECLRLDSPDQQAEPKPHYSRLLALPRELRDVILEHLIDEPCSAPCDPDHAGDRVASVPQVPTFVYRVAKSSQLSLLKLKLCSRQLHAEVKDLLRKYVLQNDTAPFCLDIMVRGSCLWPTWTSLPPAFRSDVVIDVNLRIWETSDAGPTLSGPARCGLGALIDMLVTNGPCLDRSVKLTIPCSVSVLSFDVIFCSSSHSDEQLTASSASYEVYDQFERLVNGEVGHGHVKKLQVYHGAGNGRQWKLKRLLSETSFHALDD